MRKITILNKDLGFWTQEPITVQRFHTVNYPDGDFEKELVWCNHADAELISVYGEASRLTKPDITIITKIWICPKCEAYRQDGDSYWQDAPVEGVSYV